MIEFNPGAIVEFGPGTIIEFYEPLVGPYYTWGRKGRPAGKLNKGQAVFLVISERSGHLYGVNLSQACITSLRHLKQTVHDATLRGGPFNGLARDYFQRIDSGVARALTSIDIRRCQNISKLELAEAWERIKG